MRRVWFSFSLLVLVAAIASAPLLAAPVRTPAALGVGAPADTPAPAPRATLAGLLAALVVGIAIKDTATLAKKYSSRASNAMSDYTSGVKDAGPAWQAGVESAGPNYQAGVTAAIADGRYEKGVREAGSTRYVDKASKVGPQRYQTGVQGAEADWQKGFAPVAAALSSLQLPPKGPKRSPQNMQRVSAVTEALGKLKTGK